MRMNKLNVLDSVVEKQQEKCSLRKKYFQK